MKRLNLIPLLFIIVPLISSAQLTIEDVKLNPVDQYFTHSGRINWECDQIYIAHIDSIYIELIKLISPDLKLSHYVSGMVQYKINSSCFPMPYPNEYGIKEIYLYGGMLRRVPDLKYHNMWVFKPERSIHFNIREERVTYLNLDTFLQ